MAVTNFQSVISTQSGGTADVQALAASFDKLSQSIEGATKNANKVNEHPGFDEFAKKVKSGIQDPLGALGSAAESALKALGPLGTGVAAAAGIFTAAGVAAFSAAKSLGELGVQIQNVELRTGLTSKQVGQFGFAAKAVGQDVSIFERMMRGLTMAVEDQSTKGEAARVWLGRFHVDINAVKDGSASTAETIQKVAQGLQQLPTQFERNKAALDIFKKSGIEAIPVLLELNKNLRIARENGFGLSESEAAKYADYLQKITVIETKWDRIVRLVKEHAASLVFDSFGDPDDHSRAGRLTGPAGERHKTHDTPADIEAREKARRMADADMALDGRVRNHVKELNEQLKEAREKLKTSTEVVAELGKRSDEIFLKAAFGDESGNPYGKYQYSLGRISTEREDALRKNPQPQFRREINSRFNEQVAAAKMTFAEEWQNFLMEFDKKGVEFNKHLEEEAAKLGRDTNKLGEDFIRENPQMFDAKNYVSKPVGISAEEQLRDVRDNERRGISLYGLQANIQGVSQGQQIAAVALLRKKYADEEFTLADRIAQRKRDDAAAQDAADEQHRKYVDADLERQTGLLDLALRQKEAFQNAAVGFLNAGRSGGGRGLSQFMMGELNSLEDKIVGNAAGMLWNSKSMKQVMGSLHMGKEGTFLGDLLGGTPFGPDPTKDAGMVLLEAGKKLDLVADKFLGTGAAGGGSATGGAGSGPPVSGFLRKVLGIGGGSGSSVPDIPGTDLGGGWGLGGYDGTGMSQAEWNQAMGSLNTETGPDAGGGGFSTIAGNAGKVTTSALAKGVGIGAAAAAAGFGAYSGFKSGGAQGALMGSGSLLGGAGAIMGLAGMTGPAAPIVAGVGLALGLVSSLLGDPKQRRSHQIEQELKYNQFLAPVAINASMTTGGTYADFDRFGGTRGSSLSPFPTVEQGFFDYRHNITVPGRVDSSFGGSGGPPAPQVVVNVNAIDSKSFNDNSHLVADAVQHALMTGRATGLQETLRRL